MADYAGRAYYGATVSDPRTHAGAIVAPATIAGQPAVVVAFRGSCAPMDFIQDAEVYFTDLIEGDDAAAVHHGFLEDFKAINVEVIRQVRLLLNSPSLNSQPPGIYITGHSLGGALAILCALEFSWQQLAITQVITFGQPRVGNAVFRDIYNASPVTGHSSLHDITFRIVNQNDVVPRTPGVLLSYRHCGQEVLLDPYNGFELNPPLIWKLLLDMAGLWQAYSKRQDVLITEHFIGAYQLRLSMQADIENGTYTL